MKVYIIADTHFLHEKIIEYVGRPFENAWHMNRVMISNWNNIVAKDDIVWHLGDFALGQANDILKIVSQLNGRKNLIYGNHDRQTAAWYYRAGFQRVFKRSVIMGKVIYSHAPEMNIPPGIFNIHGHVHNGNKNVNNQPLKYRCVCVEQTNYKPILLKEVLDDYKKALLSTYHP